MKPALALSALLLLAVLALSGCASMKPATIDGECRAFPDPGRVVRGAERIDQRWIDKTIETGVQVCGWPRPKAPSK